MLGQDSCDTIHILFWFWQLVTFLLGNRKTKQNKKNPHSIFRCPEHMKASKSPRANWVKAGVAPGQFLATLPGLIFDGGLQPALSTCHEDDLPFPLVIRALGFSWAGADSDVIISWCCWMTLFTELVPLISLVPQSWTEKNIAENQGGGRSRPCKGEAPLVPSSDYQSFIMISFYLTQFLVALSLEKS